MTDFSNLTPEQEAALAAAGIPVPKALPAKAVDAEVVDAEAEAPSADELPAGWPEKGYSGPQPWEVEKPPAINHREGFVTSGSAGEDVLKLCALLKFAGYDTPVTKGENPQLVMGAGERAAVAAFHRDYGIQEDPAVISATVNDVVGPWTWEALYRIGNRQQA